MAAAQHKLFALAAWFLSIAGLSWQMYFILAQYYRYPIATEIMFDVPQSLVVPSLYFIVDYNVTPYKKFWVDYSKTPTKVFEFFPKEDEIFLQQPRKSGAISKHVWHRKMCYRVDPKTAQLHDNKKRNFLYSVVFNLSRDLWPFATEYHLAIASNTTEFNELNLFDVGTATEFPERQLTYEFLEVKKLPYPYTDCVDYASICGAISVQHCVKRCETNYYLNSDEMPPIRLIHSATYKAFSNNTVQRKHGNSTAVHELCKQKFPTGPPCEQEYYFVAESLDRTFSKLPWLSLKVFSSTRPETRCVFTPVFNLVDLIVYVVSAVSFWLGVTPLTLMLKLGNRSFNAHGELKCRRKFNLLSKRLIAQENAFRFHCSSCHQS